jgi:hypothetical protein
MKIIWHIKVCLNGIYTIVRLGKNWLDAFPIQNCLTGDASASLLFNSALEYSIWKIQEN